MRTDASLPSIEHRDSPGSIPICPVFELEPSTMNRVGELFQPEPMSWGLRGDPFLWRAMALRFLDVPLPMDAIELATLLEAAFSELTGHSPYAREPFRVEAMARGGMSSGGISPVFWRDTAFPLLLHRYADAAGGASRRSAGGRPRCVRRSAGCLAASWPLQ
jgi:molybdenum cofactor cytidylyltransferase